VMVPFVSTNPPLSVSGSCSGSWERCTSAELSVAAPPPFGGPVATKPSAMVPFCEHQPAALGERQL
jgi:hypothetical protein